MAPVQTDATTLVVRGKPRRKSSISGLAASRFQPGPPVTMKASAGGQSAKPWWATISRPPARRTDPARAATTNISMDGSIRRAIDSTP